MNDKIEISFKIITIGNSGVGKTSIFARFLYDIFEQNLLSTIGINYTSKNINLNNGKKIQLKLFDTAGQERFQSLSKSYFRNADAVLFVYAANDIKSFENIKDWIKIFMENNNRKDIPLYLIENKNDLNREIEENLIDDFLNEYNFKFKSISAKLNEDNSINELFMELSELLYNIYEKSEKSQNTQKFYKLNPKKPKEPCILCKFYY